MGFLNPKLLEPIDPRVMARALGIGFKRLAGTAQGPLDWYNAIAGVGPRAELGGISGRGVIPSVMDPGHSTETTHAAERRMHLPVRNGGLIQGLEDFGVETAADPTFQAGLAATATGNPEIGIPLDLLSLAARGARAARLGSRLEEAVPAVRRFADWAIHEQGSVHRAATRTGEDVVKGHESAGRNVHTRQDIAHENLVSEHAEEMDRLNQLPPEVRYRLLQRAYREGSRKVRNQAVRAGYRSTAAEKASPPLGILTEFRDAYMPKQRLHPRPQSPDLAEKLESPYRRIRRLAPKPGFNLPQKVGDESASLSERVADRLQKGTRLEHYYSTRNKILTDLGLAPAASRPAIVVKKIEEELSRPGGPNEKALRRYRALLGKQHEAVKGGEELRAQMLKPGAALHEGTTIPEDVYQRLFGDIVRPNPSPLKELSDASREALFSVTSIPHKKNISILQALGPAGLGGIVRGARYARKLKRGDPALAERVKQLEGIGGTEHFIRNPESDSPFAAFGPAGRWLARRGTAVGEALDRFDTGQRLALQDALAKRGVTGFKAGGQIRDTLGDYKSKTQLVDLLRNQLGAPFPQWHLGIVPKAVGKALVENPNAAHLLTRGENLTNKDVMEPMFGADLHVGGPLEEGLQFWNMPFGLERYLGSQSDTGPLGEAYRDVGSLAKGNPGAVLSDLARTYVPGGGLLEDLTSTSNFKGPGSPAATMGLDLLGSYLTKPKKQTPGAQLRQSLREQMEMQGVPKPAIDLTIRQLRFPSH